MANSTGFNPFTQERSVRGSRAPHLFCRSPLARSARYESLEDRRLLAVLTVDFDQDVIDFGDGKTSLREAIFAANIVPGADEIVFDFGHDGPATILLTQGELAITEALTITGPGAELLTIDAIQQSRVFNITATTGDFAFAGLKLTGGKTTERNVSSTDTTNSGGGIRAITTGNLTLSKSIVELNHTSGINARGGGVFTLGAISLIESIVSGNSTSAMDARGGGVYARGPALITQSAISGNSTLGANAFGGGISVGDTLTLTKSTISGNSTSGNSGYGGGIFSAGRLIATASVVNGNSTTGRDGRGGGIFTTGGVMITESIVSSNTTTGFRARGGGIDSRGDITLTQSTVTGNSTWGDNSQGGGISTLYGNVMLSQSDLIDNSTKGLNARGGGIYSYKSISLIDSTISKNGTHGNSASGGGVFARGRLTGPPRIVGSLVDSDSTLEGMSLLGASGLTIIRSTLSGNFTMGTNAYGGGLFTSGSMIIHNSTVADNRVTAPNAKGGGVWILYDPAEISHSIIAGNAAVGGSPDLGSALGIFSTTYSLIGTNAGTMLTEAPIGSPDANGNNIGGSVHGLIDPLLGPLADNGGPTKTHALLPGSPAINAGDSTLVAGVGGVPEFDQRGGPFTRIAGGRIDIGAFEAQSLIVDTLVDENDGDYSSGSFSLREAIELANQIAGANTIEFKSSLAGGTILLTQGELKITDSMDLIGLGANLLAIDASGNDPTPDVNNNDGSRLFRIDAGPDGLTKIEGLTLTGGDMPGDGGAIYALSALDVVGTRIVDNSGVEGGAVYYRVGNRALHIEGSRFTDNYGGYGGAIYVHNFGSFAGKVVVGSSEFVNNESVDEGGAIYVIGGSSNIGAAEGGEAIITDTQFIGNVAAEGGGALYVEGGISFNGPATGGAATITDSQFIGNVAEDGGGAVWIDGGSAARSNFSGGATATILRSAFLDNHAGEEGGAIFTRAGLPIGASSNVGGSQISITDSVVSGNSAGDEGGGVFSGFGFPGKGIVSIANSEISNNVSGDDGGGIYAPGQLVLTASRVLRNSAARSGGGIHVRLGATINDSTIDGNISAEGGGLSIGTGVLENAPTNIARSIIANNSAFNNGGGIYARAVRATISGTTISGNTGHLGGGVFGDSLYMVMQDSLISDNTAKINGGGIFSRSGSGVIETSIVTGNSAGRSGGGIAVSNRTTAITESTISNNSAVLDGGGIWAGFHEISVSDSTISGNSAGNHGGGIWTETYTGQFSNFKQSTISDNNAMVAGGGIWTSGHSSISQVTITGNSAGTGAGLYVQAGENAIDHSILADNETTGFGPDLVGLLGVIFEVHYSLIGNSSGSGFIEAPLGSPDAKGNLIGGPVYGVIDPLLGRLADNGGPTKTHALLPGSPAINAGDPALVAGENGVPEFDQRGAPFTRIAGGRIDIGAYESQPAAGAFDGDFDGDGDVDGRDFLAWQRGYGASGPEVIKSNGDATGDHDVDANDLAVWQATYGEELSAVSSQSSAIQETNTESQEAEFRLPLWSLDSRRFTTGALDVDLLVDELAVELSSVDSAFESWTPPRRLRFDFGDIATRRAVGRELVTADFEKLSSRVPLALPNIVR